jgi:crotonobetainyl-CoA:carnitine CoA-transferase CaiB-like acyl-CoA transferase
VHGVNKAPARRAPDLGEHNGEVLELLGFSPKEIDSLQASGVVQSARKNAAPSGS